MAWHGKDGLECVKGNFFLFPLKEIKLHGNVR